MVPNSFFKNFTKPRIKKICIKITQILKAKYHTVSTHKRSLKLPLHHTVNIRYVSLSCLHFFITAKELCHFYYELVKELSTLLNYKKIYNEYF